MREYKRLTILPEVFQRNWMARLEPADPNPNGAFRLVECVPITGSGDLRLVVMVVDEDGFPIPNVQVAFSYDTAQQFTVSEDFTWSPPSYLADVFPTKGSGEIEHIAGSTVKKGQPGGVTVFILERNYSSDYVTGAGVLSNHTGMRMTFQLQRPGVVTIVDRLHNLEQRLTVLEDARS